MPREYPAFIIDRSKRSIESKHQSDFVVCTDGEVGFIAKIYRLSKPIFEDFKARIALTIPKSEVDVKYVFFALKDSAMVLEVVRYLYEPLVNKSRIKPLLKKAMKAYIYGEIEAVRGDRSDLDEQIGALSDVIDIAVSQQKELSAKNGEAATNEFINRLSDAKNSLESIKKINLPKKDA